jgi:hypothetical protein
MLLRCLLSLALLGSLSVAAGLLSPQAARADDVRYYTQDGVNYCETRQVIQRPVVETHYEDQQRTVYVEQYKTQMQPVTRTYQVPVTTYTLQTYWVNRWNPFVEPTQASRYVPQTHYETRTDTVQVPVLVREVVPQQQTVKMPITTQRTVSEEHIARVPVSVIPVNSLTPTTAVAAQPARTGGVSLAPSAPTQPSTAFQGGNQAVQR